jgi:hypothetical protein
MAEEIEETPVEEKTEEKCELCEMEPITIAVAAARNACNAIEDPKARQECGEWAKSIDGDNYKNAKDILKESIRRTGAAGLNVTPRLFNVMSRQAITEIVEEDLAFNAEHPGEERVIDPTFLDHYKKYAQESLGQ